MSFASETKNELARVEVEKKCCQLAEIAGFLRVAGSLRLAGGGRFRIVINQYNSDKAARTAENLRKTLCSNETINKLVMEFTPNICVTKCPDDVKDFKTLIALGENFHD